GERGEVVLLGGDVVANQRESGADAAGGLARFQGHAGRDEECGAGAAWRGRGDARGGGSCAGVECGADDEFGRPAARGATEPATEGSVFVAGADADTVGRVSASDGCDAGAAGWRDAFCGLCANC